MIAFLLWAALSGQGVAFNVDPTADHTSSMGYLDTSIAFAAEDQSLLTDLSPYAQEDVGMAEVGDGSQPTVDAARLAADPQRVKYNIAVRTGNSPNASTQSPVYLTVHGTDGDTGEFSLIVPNSPYSPLKRDTVTNMTKSLKDVGKVTKIQIRNPSRDDFQCDSVLVEKGEATSEFKVNKWVVSPKQSTRWAHAEVEYILMVTTGANDKADTTSAQYITVYGEDGSTGEMKLSDKFEKETTVEVTLKARDVGTPSAVILHNPDSDEWFCETIKMVTGHGTFDFSANKWVSTPQHPTAHVAVDKVYQVRVMTPPGPDSATDGDVNIQLFGVDGASSVHLLSKGIPAGTNTSMELAVKDVGRVTKIELSTESKDGWHCEGMDIRHGDNELYNFRVNGWVQSPMASTLSVLADVTYQIKVKAQNFAKTGDYFIHIYGTLGATRKLMLAEDGMDGQNTEVNVQARDVGEITKLRLTTKDVEGWKCQDITIRKTGTIFPFSVDRWNVYPVAASVDVNVDIKYTFTVTTGTMRGASTTAMIYITLYGSQGQSRYLPLKTGFTNGTVETVSFKTQDVGQLTRVKLTTTATDDWLCDHIAVGYKDTEVNFEAHKWLVFPTNPQMYLSRFE